MMITFSEMRVMMTLSDKAADAFHDEFAVVTFNDDVQIHDDSFVFLSIRRSTHLLDGDRRV